MRWIFFALFLFAGCASKSYLLPAPKAVEPVARLEKSIGVSVDVSEYLLLGKVAYKKGSTLYFDEKVELAEDTRSFLQKSLVEYLKKALEDPNVSSFPWEVDRMPDCVVRVDVKEMYVDEERKRGVAHIELSINDKVRNIEILSNWKEDRVSTIYALYEALLRRVAKEVGRSCR